MKTEKIQRTMVVINQNHLNDIEQEIADAEAAIEEKKQLLEQKKAAEQKEKQARKNELYTQIKQLKAAKKAMEERAMMYKQREDIDAALNESDAIGKKISAIEPELGDEPLVEEIEEETLWEKVLSSAGTLVLAVCLFAYLSFLSYNHVIAVGDEINVANKIAQDTGNVSQMLPPSISKLSFQKAWFSWLNVFTTLLGAILIMAVIAPAQLIFILPFTQTPVKKWKHFFEQTEEQKQWQSYAYLAVILLFLSLIHIASGAK